MNGRASAVDALLFYATRSLKNGIVRRARRLAEPRYLVGFAVGLAYVAFVLFGRSRPSRHAPVPPFGANLAGGAELLAAAALLVGAALIWLLRGREASLSLTEGEAQFLFAAPISRRAVVHFALVRSQLRVLSGALVAAFLARPGSAAAFLRAALGGWVLFSVWNLHLLGVGFTKAAWAERPVVRRRVSRVAAALLALGAIALVAAAGVEALSRAASSPHGLSPLAFQGALLSSRLGRPLLAVLLPFRALSAPLFAPTTGLFLASLPVALLLLALHYVWVVGTNVRYEDATLEGAARRAAERARRERGHLPALPGERRRRVVPFPLAPRGRPEIALAWKNLLAWKRLRIRTQVLGGTLLLLVLFVASALFRQREADAAGGTVVVVLAAVGALLAVTLPAGLRNDLRGDLEQAAVLKSWPVAPVPLVLGEFLAPLFISIFTLAVGIGGALSVSAGRALHGAATAGGPPFGLDRPETLVPVALAAFLFLPPLTLLVLLGQNAATLAFPAWFPPGQRRTKGLEQFGIRIVAALVTLVLLGLALIPSGILVALVLFLGGRELGLWVVPLSAFLGALPLWAEAAAGIALVARLWERFDPSLDLPE